MKALFVVGLVAVLLVAACGSDDTPAPTQSATATTLPEPTEPASPTPVTESQLVPLPGFEVASDIVNNTLEDLVIQVGTTVTWTQQDGFTSHTATADVKVDGVPIWDSPTLREGGTFSHTFNEVGSVRYFCRIHPGIMVATVTVVEPVEGGASSLLPTEAQGALVQDKSDLDYYEDY